ncbi:MAG: metallophosphoesterase [Candidatus Marinimicrobia bacterium]|nr:metallophosphoesterase [Candidatus Neomarinimicrobiota bacterium]
MTKLYAVGDVHGCSASFRHLLIHVLKISPEDRVYCLGDYIDRGPDARGVVDLILELREKDITSIRYAAITSRCSWMPAGAQWS